jgi:disulfide bond formation protein DsbB
MTDRHFSHAANPSFLSYALNFMALAGICLSLIAAFYFQIAHKEIPCPLCQMQRVGLLLVGFGFALNLRFGPAASHYALIIFSAITGAAISMRQDLLHIAPNDLGYGSPFLSLHLYTWGFISFICTIVFVAFMLLVDRNRLGGNKPAIGSWLTGSILILFLVLSLANLVSTTMVCNFGECPSDPTEYLLKFF